MIETLLRSAVKSCPDKPFILCPDEQWSYAEFYAYIHHLVTKFEQFPEGRVACYVPDSPALIATIFAAAIGGKSLTLFNRAYSSAQLNSLIEELSTAVLITNEHVPLENKACQQYYLEDAKHLPAIQPPTEDEAQDSEILILTSGTTGKPKCAAYSWSHLLEQVRHSPAPETNERWLLAYRLNHFAGIQMLAHVLTNFSTLVLSKSEKVTDTLKALNECAVSHISATPTFWRFALALLDKDHHYASLKHITLGSEAVPASLLKQLSAYFPGARIVQIYASTEAGSCIAVDDQKPGLPLSILSRSVTAKVQFKIVDDELYVKTKHGMNGYVSEQSNKANQPDGTWRATGDIVNIDGDRILFSGRRSEIINVGGVNVNPIDVEDIVTSVTGVKLARAYGKGNPISGQIVALDIIPHTGFDNAQLEDQIMEACMPLPRHSRPRIINFVDSIRMTNHKILRQ